MPDFHHVGLTVRNIENSYRFYVDVVGFTEWDQAQELDVISFPGEVKAPGDGPGFITSRSAPFDKLTGKSGVEFKYIMLASPDGALIFQLVEYLMGGNGALELDHSRSGSLHFSFFVEDVDKKWDELRVRNDIEFQSTEVVQITPSMRSFYVKDPDGVPVELLQICR